MNCLILRKEVYLCAYFVGYRQVMIPRILRKIFARSELHRAWLLGFNGCFEEVGIKYGTPN